MPIRKISCVLLLVVLSAGTALCHAESCSPEQYFAPHDADNKLPLKAPHPEFETTRKAAARGSASEARNLAAFYESGYLVSACPEKAEYWYAKAARHEDPVAKAWMDQRASMARVRASRECFGDSCFAASGSGVQQTVVHADAGGAYTAVVTINGKTVRGLVDTGATLVSMSAKTASQLGIAYSTGRRLRMRTANGITEARAVMLASVSVGDITLTNVEGAVGEADHPLLIGMSFLKRVTISVNSGGMTLVKP